MPPKRVPNRLLVLCASINDVTAWPFWKFLQMKKIRGVTDMALLAFNSDGGSFEARIDGDKYHLKNYARVRGYQRDMFESFVHRWHDPGRSYFVYGGHGMGDYVELEQNRVTLQAHELATLFGNRTFEAMLFDACFMANLDTAYHLRRHTRYIGACEGYMWEPDTALDYHVFNTHNASAMSRFKDPLHILRVIQSDYCGKAPRGDFSIIDTTHVAALRRFVEQYVVPRVYDRATFYSLPQQERLKQLAEAAVQAAIAEHGHPGGDGNLMEGVVPGGLGHPSASPLASGSLALSVAARPARKQRLLQAVQFEHALFPSEDGDKQLLDLKSYLTDMAQEAQLHRAWEAAAIGPQRRIAAGRRRVRSDALLGGKTNANMAGAATRSSTSFAVWHPPPSRTLFVDRHGRLPPAAPTTAPPSLGEGAKKEPDASVASDSTVTATATATVTATATSSTSPFSPLTPNSPGYKGSAEEGLDLFQQVVLNHTPPKAASIYASHLGGLSFTVHEYSADSKPIEPWAVDSKKLLRRRAKEFLKNGALAEVEMEATKPHTSVATNTVLAAVSQIGAAASHVAAVSSAALSAAPLANAAPLTSTPSVGAQKKNTHAKHPDGTARQSLKASDAQTAALKVSSVAVTPASPVHSKASP